MAKLKASLADVSTEYVLPPPEEYTWLIKKFEEKEVGAAPNGEQRIMYTYEVRIADEGDHHNKPANGQISLHTKDGELNQMGLIELKRFFEAVVGEEAANSPDADTDELINGLFKARCYHENWKQDNGRSGVSVKIDTRTMSPA